MSTTDATDEIEAVWRAFARERQFDVVACRAAPLDIRLAGVVRGVPLDVHRVTMPGVSPIAHLTVKGRAGVASTGFVRVTPATTLSPLASRLGFDRRTTSDPEIDATLYVEGVSDASVRAMLPSHARAALLAFAASGAFDYEHAGATARIAWDADSPDLARLDAAIALIVASCGADVSERW